MAITGDDLRAFASSHPPLAIHPSKDPDEWASIINDLGGKCHCDPNRICPCEKAIEEVTADVEPKFQKCACTFYVSPEYLAEYGYDKKMKKAAAKKQAPKQEITPLVDDEVSRKLSAVAQKVKTAKDLVDKEAYDDSIEALAKAIEESGCDTCEAILVPEMVHVEYARGLCGVDADACKKEIKALKSRFDDIIAFYERAMKPPLEQSQEEKPSKPSSDYHQCLKGMLTSDELAQYKKELKFYIASKVCSGKAATIDDALMLATSEHPEWF